MRRKETSGAAKPRYRAIAQALLHKIQSGQPPVGSLLASESELGEKFRASRGTIRQALALLEKAGLIVRRQRTGTRIVTKFPARGLVDGEQILEDWARYGTDYPLQIEAVTRSMPPRELLLAGQKLSRKPWLAVTGLRYPPSSRTPISFCEAFIHPEYADVSDDLPVSAIPLFALVEQRYGRVIEVVRAELRAVALAAHMAAKLGAQPGEPALQIVRYFMDARRRVVEIAMNTHPTDRYTYCIEIVRARDGAE